jgi:hypothetical protein
MELGCPCTGFANILFMTENIKMAQKVCMTK